MTNKGFEILEHTADLRIKAWGKTKEELFKNALKGMAHIQKPAVFEYEIKNQKSPPKADPPRAEKIKITITVASSDITVLLIDFLSATLTQSQINRCVFYDVRFITFSDTALEAEIEGIKVEEFDEDIKAVTYHEAEVKQNEEGNYETKIVFDI